MRKMALATGLFVLMISVVFGAAHADPLPLVNNGGGLIYDPNLGITWYDYTYTGPAGNGATWPQAMSWASSLTAGGVSNWTLPTTLPVNGSTYNINIVTVSKGPFSGYFSPSFDGSTDFGFNISAPGSAYPGSKGSEMAYLYYVELGNKGYYDTNGNGPYQADSGLQHTGPFSNLLSREYWSGTEYEPGTAAWLFYFNGGFQGLGIEDSMFNFFDYAIAVHAGDVGAPVPIPVAILLFAPGLAGLAALKKKYIG